MEDKLKITGERNSSRAIVLNDKNEIFLFQYVFDYFKDGNIVRITPGGGLEPGEDYEDALRREINEEMGIFLKEVPQSSYYRDATYTLKNGENVIAHELFYVIHIESMNLSFRGWTESEKIRMKKGKWWSREEIEKSADEFFAKEILRLLDEACSYKEFDKPREIS